MADELVYEVHGDRYKFVVKRKTRFLGADEFAVYRDDGKYIAGFSSRADAVRRADQEAGPNRYSK